MLFNPQIQYLPTSMAPLMQDNFPGPSPGTTTGSTARNMLVINACSLNFVFRISLVVNATVIAAAVAVAVALALCVDG
jgi:hypothetical protein